MIVLPTLSIDGYASERTIIMTKLFEYFLSTDANQSNFFRHRLSSLKFILRDSKNPSNVENKIKEILTNLYSKYFDSVTVVVNRENSDNEGGYVAMSLDITAHFDGKTYTLSKLIKYNLTDPLFFDDKINSMYEDEEFYKIRNKKEKN